MASRNPARLGLEYDHRQDWDIPPAYPDWAGYKVRSRRMEW